MTKEEIKNWSNENGLGYRSDLHKMYEDLYRSAYSAGAAAEREACAEVCKKQADVYAGLEPNPTIQAAWAACIDNRDAIRARGEQA
jgi:hypothetical protein